MSGMINAITLVQKAIDSVVSGDVEITKTDIDLIRANGSLTKLLSKFVIEPVIVCSKGSKQIPVFDKLLQLHVDVFSSFYFQAFKILTDVNGLDSKLVFDVLSTDNNIILDSMSMDSFKAIGLGAEAHKPGSINELFKGSRFLKLSTEAPDDNEKVNSKIHNDDSNREEILKGLLQKTFNVDIILKADKGSKTIQIPVIVKAHVIVTDVKNILNMLQPNAKEKSLWYRFNEWRAGSITLGELIFCGDLIKEYKNNRISDKDGLMEILESRKNNSMQRALLNKATVGFERNYNMLIFTADDKLYFDKHIGGDITNEKNKQKLLSEAHALTYTLADADYERVNMYTRDIRGSSDIGFKALSGRKDNAGELGELIKSLLLSKPMSF